MALRLANLLALCGKKRKKNNVMHKKEGGGDELSASGQNIVEWLSGMVFIAFASRWLINPIRWNWLGPGGQLMTSPLGQASMLYSYNNDRKISRKKAQERISASSTERCGFGNGKEKKNGYTEKEGSYRFADSTAPHEDFWHTQTHSHTSRPKL